MEIIKSTRGKDKLCYNGHMYVQKITKKNWIRWVCHKQRSNGCKGALTSSVTFEHPRSFVEHNHAADAVGIEVTKLRSTMKSRAKDINSRPNQVVAQCLQDVTDSVRARIGRLETCKRDLRRQKRGALPKEPDSLPELTITEEWATTSGEHPRRFLLHDSGPDSHPRVIVFATNEGLRTLAAAHTWHMDGTFSMCPRIFTQLYSIRVPLGNTAVSCVYGFIQGKSQEAYETFLRAVLAGCEDLGFSPDPGNIVTDFEMATLQAISTVFGPDVHRQGCFYHLTQSTWRKIQDLGLVNLYRTNADAKHFCGMLDGLALLPLDKVSEGMSWLKDNTPPELVDLVSYFDSTYVSGTLRRIQPVALDPDQPLPPLRFRRIPPLFPPEAWNVHTVTMEGRDRTNNICEGWNFAFKQLVGHQHPALYTTIDALRKDSTISSTMIVQYQRGEPIHRPQKRAYQQHQNRLHTLCNRIAQEEIDVEEFLDCVGHSVRL